MGLDVEAAMAVLRQSVAVPMRVVAAGNAGLCQEVRYADAPDHGGCCRDYDCARNAAYTPAWGDQGCDCHHAEPRAESAKRVRLRS